ncbi:chemotaxis protein CheW [Pseudoduganella sp. LjRoot289]|uniref:chemotaxis protein CheW n=1 Tax=Pseudoduganella sp. LjRoot289 TaxID=3342314 RepID=UPI003ED0B18A
MNAAIPNTPARPQAGTAGHTQYLTFMLGTEMFAIGILAIKEIIEYSGVTTVPMMPASICGVINLRGAVVPVLDLAVRFGRVPSPPTKRTCVVIVEMASDGGQQVLGVLVDSVSAVLEIAGADIEPAPTFGARVPGDFIEGMGKVDGKFVILLQLSEVLSVDQLVALSALHGADAAATQDACA